MMLVFVKLKRQNQTLVHAATPCFYSRNNLCNYWQYRSSLPPHSGWGWRRGQEGFWDICSEVFRYKDLEILTSDFNEILSLKSVITKSTDSMPPEGWVASCGFFWHKKITHY